MKAIELIRRKYIRQRSDLQMIILLTLAERGSVRFMDLVESTGATPSGVGNALVKPWFVDFIERDKRRGGAYYSLSPAGRREVAEILGHAPMRRRSAC